MKENSQTKLQIPLEPGEILMAEYNYASQNAFQANNDRVQVFNFIFANSITLVVAAVLSNNIPEVTSWLFSVVFLFLGFIGLVALLQLIRLRQAWLDSVLAMNKIKQFYEEHTELEISPAFRWKITSIPPGDKLFSLSFSFILIITVTNSLALTLSAAFFFRDVDNLLFVLYLPMLFVIFIVQMIFWKLLSGKPH
jgi:hypothetical protein